MTSFNIAIRHLSQDPILQKIIRSINLPTGPSPDTTPQALFSDIIETIIGQQLSNKAANTIVARFKVLFGDRFPTPHQLLRTPDQRIRDCGTSWSKIKYIKNVAQSVVDGQLDLSTLPLASDEEVQSELLRIKGIGPWTAEMVLMFTLGRPDVFSPGDVGLQNAIAKYYGTDRKDKKQMEIIASRWSPHRTLACRYLWRSLEL